jgi:hypothetical protein
LNEAANVVRWVNGKRTVVNPDKRPGYLPGVSLVSEMTLTVSPTMNVVEVPVDRLKPHPLNPSKRTESIPKAMIDDVATNGITTPLHVMPNGTILAGHRRWTAAKAAGLRTVPCIVRADQTVDDLNPDEEHRKRVRSEEWLGVYVSGKGCTGINKMPKSTRRQCDMLRQLVGDNWNDLQWLVDSGISPPIVLLVERTAARLAMAYPDLMSSANGITKLQILRWIVAHKQQVALTVYLKEAAGQHESTRMKTLRSRIARNVPLDGVRK